MRVVGKASKPSRLSYLPTPEEVLVDRHVNKRIFRKMLPNGMQQENINLIEKCNSAYGRK